MKFKAKEIDHKKKISFQEYSENKAEHLRDFVYGALDGIITTFAVIAGVAGANLEIKIGIILGFYRRYFHVLRKLYLYKIRKRV